MAEVLWAARTFFFRASSSEVIVQSWGGLQLERSNVACKSELLIR